MVAPTRDYLVALDESALPMQKLSNPGHEHADSKASASGSFVGPTRTAIPPHSLSRPAEPQKAANGRQCPVTEVSSRRERSAGRVRRDQFDVDVAARRKDPFRSAVRDARVPRCYKGTRSRSQSLPGQKRVLRPRSVLPDGAAYTRHALRVHLHHERF